MSQERTTLKKLVRYVFMHKKLFWASFAVIIVNSIATLAPAEWGQHVVRLVENKQFSTIPLLAVIAFVIIIAKVFTDFMRKYLMNWLGQLISTDIQKDFHAKLLSLPMTFFREHEMGQLLSKTTNDITIVRMFFSQNLPSLLKDPLVILFGLFMLLTKNLIFTIELLVVGLLIALVMQVVGNKIRQLSRKVQNKVGKTVSNLHDSLYSIDIIKLFGREQYHTERFDRSIKHFLKMSRKEIVLDAAGTPINEFLSFFAAFIVIGTGIFMIDSGTMKPNELVSFVVYLAILSQPLNAVTNLVLQYKKATASAQRIFELLDEQEENPLSECHPVDSVSGKIVFHNVSFSYSSQKPVLKKINLTIHGGETIALVGPSGSGKTTLVNLLSRLFIPDSGTILFDNYDTSKISLASLRKQIGYVTQDNVLFPGTVIDNIRYGRLDATTSDIIQAAKSAHADIFIKKLPHGYSTRIGERGSKLSGGQRQRIAMARVLLRQPSILVLDEATSALDTVSERHVHNALKKILHKQTTIIIAHRLSTVMLAARIIVLDSGRIVEPGTHADLLKKRNSLYSKLWSGEIQGKDTHT